jgi:hypothetical protein
MGNPLSNPTPSSSQSAYPGGVKGNSAQKKRAGTTQRLSIPVGGGTRGKSVTMTGVGTEGGTPEAGRAAQDAARGTVHGQPRTAYNDGNNTGPIPNKGS